MDDAQEGMVRFELPDLCRLADDGLAAVDMHLHTNHSDAPVPVEKALRKASAEGYGIAVTDHNEVSGSLEAFARRGEVMVVPGIEISAADGPHILAYFYSPRDLGDFHRRHIAPNQRNSPWLAIRSGTQDIVDALEGYPCLKVAAHPYGYLIFNKGLQKCIDLEYLGPEIVDGFEGFEVVCGGMSHSQNLRAVDLVSRTGKCFTGGTDGHLLRDQGSVVTCARATDHTEFLEAVERRENLVVGREKRALMKLATGTALMGKHSRYLLPSMRIHLEQNAPRVRHFMVRKVRRYRERNGR